VLDEVRKRHELLMNPRLAPVASALTSFGFLFHLGLSPASALVNLTQTPLVAYPMLAASGASAARLGAHARQRRRDGPRTTSPSAQGRREAAVQKAIDEGTIDVTMAHDLAGIAQGNDSGVHVEDAPGDARGLVHVPPRRALQPAGHLPRRLPAGAEGGARTTRRSSRPATSPYASHFDYSSQPAARDAGQLAKVFLQFKQYSQNMTFTLGNNTAPRLQGDKQAMKTLAGLLVMNGSCRRGLGVPLVAQLCRSPACSAAATTSRGTPRWRCRTTSPTPSARRPPR
jgi:hypothetical protein